MAPLDQLSPAPRPNPATGATTIVIRLAEAREARLGLIDALGREIAVPFTGALEAGEHPIVVETTGLTPGIYFLRLTTTSGAEVRRIDISP